MKSILLSALFFLSLVSSFSQKYSEVKIHTSREGLATLGRMGIPVDEGYFDKSTFQTVIPAEHLEQIRKAGFIIDVIHEDYPDFISKRNRDAAREIEMINAGIRSRSVNVSSYPVPVHFELGTMGGYYTLQEVMNELDSMHALYPSLVTQKAVCTSTPTHLGRNLYYVRITNLNNTQAKPKVLYNALTHAREPMGMQQLMFYMWYLLENYSSSNEVKYLLDNLDLYFIPVVNPDGYEYNHSTNPNGGGGWRKNRRDNGGSYGVDLNRNFGYFWGFDDTGSSPVPSEDNYRGPSAFSEPETQTVRDFCIANHMVISMNYHTFSNLFLFPWCYTTKYTTDSLLDVRYAEIMTRQNRYVTGLPGEVLYNTNGDVNDWLYGDVNMKPKVISFTAEIGSSLDGFWPNVSRILPLCQENMYQNLMIAHMGYRYAEAKDASDAIVGEKQGYFSFDFTRYGMEPGGTYTISLQPLDSSQFVSVGDPVVISDPAKLIPLTDSIAYTLAPGITAGTQFRYIIRCDNGQFTFTDTVSKWYGKEMVVFSDSCNGMQHWSGNPWSATPFIYHSGPAAITDSPSGPYPNNTNSMVATRESIDLRDSPVAVLTYWMRYELETSCDFVQIKVSDSTGTNFVAQKGRHTKNGSATEAPGKPVYDGYQYGWQKEQVVLTDFVNDNIKIAFSLKSDQGTRKDGFYFDDFQVRIIDMSINGIPEKTRENSLSIQPNPAKQTTRIQFQVDNPAGVFILTDMKGMVIMKKVLDKEAGEIEIDVKNLSAGMYFCRITTAGGSSVYSKLLVTKE